MASLTILLVITAFYVRSGTSFSIGKRSSNKNETVLVMELPNFVKERYESQRESKDSTDEGTFSQGTPINPDDFERGQKLPPSDFVNAKNNPIENGKYFEGDIIEPDIIQSKNAIRDSRVMWPGGRIPYVISDEFDTRERGVIARAMQEYHTHTCLTFVPRTMEMDYIYIKKGEGCYSNVGMRTGGQEVSLGRGCVYVGTTIHEFMHAAGFYHEQSRADRDDYITVMWRNILPGMSYNFAKYSLSAIQHLGEKYDYKSVMHYGSTAFSKDRISPTIVPKESGITIGQRGGFSQTDITKIRKLYNCDDIIPEEPMFDPHKIKDSGDFDCMDLNSKCKEWSKNGYCFQYFSYMGHMCKDSCKQC